MSPPVGTTGTFVTRNDGGRQNNLTSPTAPATTTRSSDSDGSFQFIRYLFTCTKVPRPPPGPRRPIRGRGDIAD
jgi:hypothetical protein